MRFGRRAVVVAGVLAILLAVLSLLSLSLSSSWLFFLSEAALLGAIDVESSPLAAWTKPERNLLLTKIPKTGGTTLMHVVQRAVKLTPGWRFARLARAERHVATCTTNNNLTTRYDSGRAAWEEMLAVNGGQIDVFGDHACFQPAFMSQPQYWSQQRAPLAISLVRRPVARLVSKFRYTQLCCGDWHRRSKGTKASSSSWCAPLCSEAAPVISLDAFLDKECATQGDACNTQTRYMGGDDAIGRGRGGGIGAIPAIADRYAVILVLERFDESLAVLAIKLGVPVLALPYAVANTNSAVPPARELTPHQAARIASYTLLDEALYQLACARLDTAIAALDQQQRERFDRILATLQLVKTAAPTICPAFLCATEDRHECRGRCMQAMFVKYWG